MPSLRYRYVQDWKSKIKFLEILQDLKKLQEIKPRLYRGFCCLFTAGIFVSTVMTHSISRSRHISHKFSTTNTILSTDHIVTFPTKKPALFGTDFFVKPFVFFGMFPVTETLLCLADFLYSRNTSYL